MWDVVDNTVVIDRDLPFHQLLTLSFSMHIQEALFENYCLNLITTLVLCGRDAFLT